MSSLGILSSGLGGLLFVRELEKRTAGTSFVYWGDTACGPWGSRSFEWVAGPVQEGVKFLEHKSIDTMVIASGDASVVIRSGAVKLRMPAVDILESSVRAALAVSKKKRIGIVGSRLVIERAGMLGLEQEGAVVCAKAIPALTPLIMEGEEKRGEMRRLIRAHLQWFKSQNIDALILGSMHYVRVFDDIQAKMGKRITVVNPVQALVKSLLQQGELKKGEQTFHLTDVTPRDADVAREWLGRAVKFERT